MDLRDYQTDAIDKLRDSLRAGKTRPVVQMPTGAGKTIVAANIVRMALDKGKRVVFCVPAISLIDQSVEKFERNGIPHIGVIQAQHERTDRTAPVQVCSIQTLARRALPEGDLVIIDECHLMFKFYDIWMNLPEWQKVPFIGLTATPWAKGMGAQGRWDDLIIGTTTEELIKLGHLSDFKVFAPAHPDLDGVKIVAGDYKLDQLGQAMDKAPLVADIVSTWLERGQDRSTLVFAVNRAHAKHIQQQFQAAGVTTAYLDAYTDLEERNQIAKAFEAGDVRVVCNVGVLTTGVDWDVRCIILARPTRSEILYTQIIGRGLRTAEGKDHCLILDHSDTTLKLGFVTDISHDKLDDGRVKSSPKEKKAILPKECPKCAFLKPPKTKVCPSCGFEAIAVSDIDTEEGELHEITRDGRVKVEKWPQEQKEYFYRELLGYAELKSYKKGWAYHAYRARFSVGPANSFSGSPLRMIRPETASWIKSYNIRKAKAREKAAGAKFDARHPD
jgi:hypothetical protein